MVVVPSEITLLSNLKCAGVSNLPTSLSCSASSQTITITNAFSSSAGLEDTEIEFTISPLRTPLSVQTTSSFQVYSMDSSKRAIDSQTSGLTIQMTKGRAITVMTASVGDNTVNAYTSMTLSVTPSVPLKNEDIMSFTIPSAITLPSKSSLSCTGSGVLQSSIGCNING